MSIGLAATIVNLATAVALGGVIGFERQWRQRLAGLRTNTLVALGAASFVIYDNLFSPDAAATRVAAQVVSGIGFLGAGIIFREGLNVRGLNTAATLWCSAAVGVLSGWRGHRGARAGVAFAGARRRRDPPASARQLQHRGLRSGRGAGRGVGGAPLGQRPRADRRATEPPAVGHRGALARGNHDRVSGAAR